MDITNISSETYILPEGRVLSPGKTLTYTYTEYSGVLRSEINNLHRQGKISVSDTPAGFPIVGSPLSLVRFGPFRIAALDASYNYGWKRLNEEEFAPGTIIWDVSGFIVEDFDPSGSGRVQVSLGSIDPADGYITGVTFWISSNRVGFAEPSNTLSVSANLGLASGKAIVRGTGGYVGAFFDDQGETFTSGIIDIYFAAALPE